MTTQEQTKLEKAINFINSVEQKRIFAEKLNMPFIYGYDLNIKIEKCQRIIDRHSK